MLSNQSTRSLTTLVYSMQLLRGGTSQWKGEVFDLLGWSQLSPGFIVPNTFIARFVLGERLHPQRNKFSRLNTGFTQYLVVAQRFVAIRQYGHRPGRGARLRPQPR